ncbi:MAG TPA: D-alanyl-D-alanine carboxypeptidase [Blastocatellia bacterium]|nr:D-alanyl-D-alanine carboxypeptidase [Blastocatellia bacterium]
MTAARLPFRKLFTVLIAIVLTFSLAFAEPSRRGSKPKKASARSAQKKKSSSRSARVSARRGSSKSKKLVARGARRGRRSGRLTARGRRMRSRYRMEPAIVTSYGHGTRVHNYLTEVWAKSQTTTQKTATPVGDDSSAAAVSSISDTSTSPAPAASVSQPSAPAIQPATNPATNPTMQPSGVEGVEAPPINPLVAAYEDSLLVRGFNPDNQGFIVTTLNGEVLAEHNADKLFNPASVTKVATSLTAISRLGPDFKFRTSLYTDGALDRATGVLHGSLYVIGSGDPAFFYENAIMIADKLNRSGIREVEGDLVVLGQFYFGFSTSREASARAFQLALNPAKWNTTAKNAYPRFLSMRAAEERMLAEAARQEGKQYTPAPWPSQPPSIIIRGKIVTSPVVNTSNLKPLALHTSLPLVALLKGLNDFSNNWMAHVIGDLVGGPDAVERFLTTEVGFKPEEVKFATSSGLGANYISPRGTITILRKLITYLSSKGLKIEDILPVAGVDAGTLEKRFTDYYTGSVVAKTGTLSGVSALAGVAYTRAKGPLLFVIYNRGGSVHAFRAAQDETIKKIITLYGGPVPVHSNGVSVPRVSERATEPAQHSGTGSMPRE